MNISINNGLFVFLCLNFIIGTQSLDINDNSDEIEIFKHLFARLNHIIHANELLAQDIKQLHKKIEILESKFEKNKNLKISQELTNIDDIENQSVYCNSKNATDDLFNTQDVYCFGNNWIIIQRRTDGSENFYRNWNDYKNGFGDKSNEFFIGLEKLYRLTSSQPYELLIVIKDFENEIRYAKYDLFEIASESELYRLKNLGTYSGNAGDSLTYHKGANFSTKDRDNDRQLDINCAIKFMGAWWYRACHESNLNGVYTDVNLREPKKATASGIHWKSFRGQWYSLKFVQIMIRLKN